MKRLRALFATSALLIVAVHAYAVPTAFIWTAGIDSHWEHRAQSSPHDNWNDSGFQGDFPGNFNNDDTVTIRTAPSGRLPIFSSSSGATGTNERTVDTILIDAAVNGVTVSLTVSGDTLITTGTTTIKGKHSAGGSNTATLNFTGGDFESPTLNLDGGNEAANVAVLDIDASLVMSDADESTDITADRYSDVDVLTGKTLTVDDVTITPGANTALMRQIGAGSFVMDVFTMNAPTADVLNTMDIASGATFTPTSMDLNGGSSAARSVVFDTDAAVTVGATGTDFSGFVKFAGTAALDADDITISATATIDHENTADLDADSLLIDANAAAADITLTMDDDGRFDINGEAKLKSGSVANRRAKLVVNSSAVFEPNSLVVEGVPTDISSSYAVLDLSKNVTVVGIMGTDTSVDGFVDFELASGVTFDAKEMALVDSATDLKVTGANITTSIFKYDSLTTNSGTIRYIGPLTVEEYD